MSKLYLLLAVTLMSQAGRACLDGQNEEEQLASARQQSDEYFAKAFGFTSNPWLSAYYQPSARNPGYGIPYEGRTPVNRQPISNPLKKYFASNNGEEENNQPESRFAFGGLGLNLINTGLFNNRFTPTNTWKPFASLANRFPVSVNPDFSSPLSNFDACTSPSGEAGICAPGSACSLFGGRPSGSCIFGKVCCINAITTCGGTVTLNNTLWQSPSTAVSAPTTCALTVRMDTKLVEQLAKSICQIRLDFVSFTITGPSTAAATAGTCTDTFTVGGASTVAPVICGVNTGQHMYLDVPSSAISPTNVQLMFNFAAGAATRSWNIKIAMLPCGASYLAPTGCLQYFTASSGQVKSFNWQDAATAQQLNNQKYNICFRTELFSGSKATQLCASPCTVTTGGRAFFLTGSGTAAAAAANTLAAAQATLAALNAANPPDPTAIATATTAVATAQLAVTAAAATFPLSITSNGPGDFCSYDFLTILGGQNQATPFAFADRYCGSAFPASVCTSVAPFRMTFGTDDSEPAATVAAGPSLAIPFPKLIDALNTGFCLSYQEK